MSASKSELQQLIDRIAEQSPIVRWGLAFVAALVLYFAWSGFIAPAAKSWGASADAIQRQVQTVRERDRMAADVRRMRDTIITLGPVDAPVYISEGQDRLEAAVNTVRNEFRMSNDNFSVASRGTLQRGMLPGLTVSGQPTQLTGELRFDAAPDDAIAIIAALESRPEVARISDVVLTRIGNRRVNVRLTIESWVVSSESPRAGRV